MENSDADLEGASGSTSAHLDVLRTIALISCVWLLMSESDPSIDIDFCNSVGRGKVDFIVAGASLRTKLIDDSD